MPRRKTSTQNLQEIQPEPSMPEAPKKSGNKLLIIALLLLLAWFVWKNKSYFVVATINKLPITRLELDQIMVERYGQQTLDNLITKKLVEGEIKKQNIQVTDAEVEEKVKEVEVTLPQGMTLEQALQMQGLTVNEFKEQLKLQIAVNKHFESQVQITDQEVDAYIVKNPSLLTSTDSAQKKEEARVALKNTKIGEMVNNWINDLRSKANIVKYI